MIISAIRPPPTSSSWRMLMSRLRLSDRHFGDARDPPRAGSLFSRFGFLRRLGLFLLRQQRLEVELAEQRAAGADLRQLGAVVLADPDDRLGDVADRLPGLGRAVGVGESLA